MPLTSIHISEYVLDVCLRYDNPSNLRTKHRKMHMLTDNETYEERDITFFMLEVERIKFMIHSFEKFCENMNCIFSIWAELNDIVCAYSVYRICEGTIFGMTHTDKAYSIIFFYRKSSRTRWGIIPQSLDMNSVHRDSLYIFYFRQYEFE